MTSLSYISEPPTTGRVVIVTSIGEFDIELFCNECPKACRNFIGLCYQSYYNQCKFHRVVKDWLVQTGDRTNTGEGGDSIYNHEPFNREIHSRLKFNRRGLIGCASDADGLNLSQFVITLNRADALTGQHTCFGKLTSQTVYNLTPFNDLEVDANDRPLNPPIIIRTDVIINPFDDLRPPQPDAINKSSAISAKSKQLASKQSIKNTVLSFDDSDEESIVISQASKPVISSKNRHKPKIPENVDPIPSTLSSSPSHSSSVAVEPVRVTASISQASNSVDQAKHESQTADDEWTTEVPDMMHDESINKSDAAKSAQREAQQMQMKREIAELTSKLFGNANKEKQVTQAVPVEKVSALDQMRAKYAKPQTKSTDVMNKLNAFKQKLRSTNQQPQAESTNTDPSATDSAATEANGQTSSWLNTRISFKKRPQDFQQNEPIEDRDFEVIDPYENGEHKRPREE